MNRFLETLLAAFSVSLLAAAADAAVTTYPATTDDRHRIDGSGYAQTGKTETFIIAAADRQGRPLTPRVERFYAGKGSIKPGEGVYTFSAIYKIDAANNTTIFQLLNHDPKSDDGHKPVCFVTVFPGANGSAWDIRRGNRTDSPLLATVSKKDPFTVKLQVNGTQFQIWINGDPVASGTPERTGKSTSMRYGAYHHGKGVAKVHVTNALFQLDSEAKMSESATLRTGRP